MRDTSCVAEKHMLRYKRLKCEGSGQAMGWGASVSLALFDCFKCKSAFKNYLPINDDSNLKQYSHFPSSVQLGGISAVVQLVNFLLKADPNTSCGAIAEYPAH